MRGRHRHVRRPLRPQQQRRPATRRRGARGPTSSSAPTRLRTIEWQKASADTAASTTPSGPRVQSRRCSARTVVAPSRRLQNAAKSCSPSNPADAAVDGVEVQRMRPGQRVAGAQRVGAPGRRGDPVAVVAAQCREPGVELRRHGRDGGDPHVGGQQPGQPAHEPRRVEVRGQVRGARPARWRAPRRRSARPPSARRAPQDHGQRIGEHPGDGAPAGLGGPAGEVGAVVGDVEPEPGGRAGLRRRRVGVQGGNGDGPAVREDDGPRRGTCGIRTSRPATAGSARTRRPRRPPASRTRPRPRSARSAATRGRGRSSSPRCP